MSESKHPKRDKFVELFKKKTGGMHPNGFKLTPWVLSAILSKIPELKEAWDEALLEENQT